MVGDYRHSALLAAILAICTFCGACSSPDGSADESLLPGRSAGDSKSPAHGGAPLATDNQADHEIPIAPPAAATSPSSPGVDNPGPAPAGGCGLPTGELFTRNSGASSYVGFVPKGYSGKPTRLLVGLHGCSDGAWNFASWGVNPYDTRDSQDYIGIAVDGASGGGNCWDNSDEGKVLAAIDDISKCLYVHKQKVVIAGFSSGGMLAYSVGLKNASRFAGILIENSTLSSAGDADALLAGATWNIHVAHRAHTQDSVFPIGTVHNDWQKVQNAGFPIDTSEVNGDHDGTSQDWTEWLLPRMSVWKGP